jgi:multidrug resistance protein, MATE family
MTSAALEKAERRPWSLEARAMLSLAFPIILANVAQSTINATDLVLLGRLNADALAAGSLAFNLYIPLLVFGIGLLAAVSPLVAAERGARRHSVREVRRTVRQGMWHAVTLAIPCWLILWHAPDLLLLLGQAPDLAAAAGRFVRIIMWSLLPIFMFFVLRNFISAIERPNWAAIVLFGQVGINALLGWALIFGKLGAPALGLDGAALGSALANLFVFLALAGVVAFVKPFRRYRIFGRWWRADWPRYRQIAAVGLPIAITLLFEVAVFAAAVFIMGLIGRHEIAAHAIALQIAAFTFMVPLGLSQAGTVRVGLAYGAADHAGIARAGWTALVLGIAFMAVMALTLILFPRALIGIFIDTTDAKNAVVVALAVQFMGIAALFQIVDGAQSVGAGVLRGLQDTRWPMIFAAFGYWVVGIGVGVALAFPFGLKGLGVWIGLASGLAVVAVLMVWRWSRREALGLLPDIASESHRPMQ